VKIEKGKFYILPEDADMKYNRQAIECHEW